MTALTIADVLISFTSHPKVRRAVSETPQMGETTAMAGAENALAALAQEHAIAAARAEGLAEGLASAAAAHEAALAALREEQIVQLAAERSRWTREEGQALAEKLASRLDEIEAKIANGTAKLLGGFLAGRLIDRATEELVSHVRTLVSGTEGKVVRITGPEDLLAALREALADAAAAIEFQPGNSPEVQIVCGNAMIESRLTPWLARLALPEE
jgi:hypothetical protein